MSMKLHDPTAEIFPIRRPRLTPPKSLEGKVVALFDIGKTRSDEFIDSLEVLLADHNIKTTRYAKPTNAKTAPIETIQAIATEADLVVSALAD
jgi:hypothetical protein